MLETIIKARLPPSKKLFLLASVKVLLSFKIFSFFKYLFGHLGKQLDKKTGRRGLKERSSFYKQWTVIHMKFENFFIFSFEIIIINLTCLINASSELGISWLFFESLSYYSFKFSNHVFSNRIQYSLLIYQEMFFMVYQMLSFHAKTAKGSI